MRIPVRRRDGTVRAWALIDPEDAWLNQWTWRLKNGYVTRWERGRVLILPRVLLGLDGTPWHADHKDGDKLNNRRANLRCVTHAQNMQNRKRHRNNTSGFSGACWEPEKQRWRAAVSLGGKKYHLGRYRTAAEAGAAADAFRAENMPFWTGR